MLTAFNCPDKVTRPISECLAKCPRKEGRCLSLPVLHEAGYCRPFIKPSVTQCLNPTRLEFLKLKHDYAIDPIDRAFALLGTNVHRKLEITAKLIEGLKAEQKVSDADTIGTMDLLEPDEMHEGQYKLIDIKTWGSYSAAKVLGRKENGESDLMKAMLQLNGYRIKVEPLIKVSRLFIMAIIRDGGTRTAEQNGVPEKMILIPIPMMPDAEVKEYFNRKATLLSEALANDKLPAVCSSEDNWNFRRCKGYCECVAWCYEGSKVARVKYLGN